jgi:hypothetical protein
MDSEVTYLKKELEKSNDKLSKIRRLVESCEESHISVLEKRIIEILD